VCVCVRVGKLVCLRCSLFTSRAQLVSPPGGCIIGAPAGSAEEPAGSIGHFPSGWKRAAQLEGRPKTGCTLAPSGRLSFLLPPSWLSTLAAAFEEQPVLVEFKVGALEIRPSGSERAAERGNSEGATDSAQGGSTLALHTRAPPKARAIISAARPLGKGAVFLPAERLARRTGAHSRRKHSHSLWALPGAPSEPR